MRRLLLLRRLRRLLLLRQRLLLRILPVFISARFSREWMGCNITQ